MNRHIKMITIIFSAIVLGLIGFAIYATTQSFLHSSSASDATAKQINCTTITATNTTDCTKSAK